MFDLLSSEYEIHLEAALSRQLREHVFHLTSRLGSPSSKCKQRVASNISERSAKRSFSASPTALLRDARELESAFLSSIPMSPHSISGGTASELHQRHHLASAHEHVQRIACDVTVSPSDKRVMVCDGLRRVLCEVDLYPALWEAVVAYLSLLAAMDAMVSGDDSVEVMLDELDLAVAYTCLQRSEIAIFHAKSCLKKLNRLLSKEKFESLVFVRVQLVLSISFCSDSPEYAQKCAFRAAQGLPAPISPYVYRLALLCAAALGAANQEELFRMLQDVIGASSSAHEIYAAYQALVTSHLSILLRCDQELRSPGVHAAREDLLRKVQAAGNRRELDLVHQQLQHAAEGLHLKINGMQLTMVRKVDALNELLSDALACPSSRGIRTWTRQALSDVIVLLVALHRVLAVGGRRDFVLHRADVLSKSVTALFGPDLGAAICLDAVACVCGEDLLQYRLPLSASRLLTRICARSELNSLEVECCETLAKTSAVRVAGSVGGPDEEHDCQERATRLAEQAVVLILQSSGTNDERTISSLQMLASLYRSNVEFTAETRVCALIASLSARRYGPTHKETIAALEVFGGLVAKVHPPTVQPSWGVQPLLTPVTLTSAVPGSEVFFSLDDFQTSERSSTVSHCVKYNGPVILDRLGRLVLRAFCLRDGTRSSVVEVHFTVQRH